MPEVEEELQSLALTVVEQATIVKIVDQPTYDHAAQLLTSTIQPMRKKWKTFWYGSDDGPVPLAFRAYKAVLAKFNEGDAPLELAEKHVKSAISKWDDEQRRIQQEKQRAAQAEAERQERERMLAQAVEAEEAGAPEEMVTAIMEAPVTAVAAVVEPTYQRAAGVSTRENWKCRVENLKELCKAIGAGKVPVTYVTANESALNARARADKSTMNIPGCKPWNDTIVSGRRSK